MDMLYEALRCAEAGLRVLPLYEVDEALVCACRHGAACEDKQRGKHPRILEWQKHASAELDCVRRWWAKWPRAGIGVATGKQSRVWVLDLDGDEALAWYKDQCRAHGLTKTRGAKTGRGRHLWWRWPDDAEVTIRNTQKQIRPGVDVRGEGGYVVVPPTMHRSGVRYEWLSEGMYVEAPQFAPAWLVELVKHRPPPPAPRLTIPPIVTPRELHKVFNAAVDTDPDLRRRIGERAGGTLRAAARPYVDDIACPACGRREVWFYIDGGPAVCHHRNSCKWAGPLTRLGGFHG